MRLLIWLLRAVIFIGLFGLAIKNSGPVELRFYFSQLWQSPLSLVILGSFAAGAILGLSAGFATMIRQRRDIARFQGQLRAYELTRHPVADGAKAPLSEGLRTVEYPLT